MGDKIPEILVQAHGEYIKNVLLVTTTYKDRLAEIAADETLDAEVRNHAAQIWSGLPYLGEVKQ